MNTEAPTHEEAGDGLPIKAEERGSAPLALDPDKYRRYLDDFELSEEQQNELLAVLWNICRTFVEIGFGVDSVQTIFSGIVEKTLQDDAGTVDRKDHFKQIAAPTGDDEERKHR